VTRLTCGADVEKTKAELVALIGLSRGRDPDAPADRAGVLEIIEPSSARAAAQIETDKPLRALIFDSSTMSSGRRGFRGVMEGS